MVESALRAVSPDQKFTARMADIRKCLHIRGSVLKTLCRLVVRGITNIANTDKLVFISATFAYNISRSAFFKETIL
jgi:hypothetical protein